ncbi:hypothetical protein EON64_16605, partial [archaeon]
MYGTLADKLLRKTVPRRVFIFNDLVLIASAREGSEVCEAQHVLYVRDLRLRHSHMPDQEDMRLSFELLVTRTRSRPQQSFVFQCEEEGAFKVWVEELESALLAYHRQTPLANTLGWFHDVIQGGVHSAAYRGDAPLLARLLKHAPAQDKAMDLPDLAGMRPLHWAALRGHELVLRALLDRGAALESV